MNPRVSVIMPVREPNVPLFRVAIRSVLEQSLSDIEVLVLEAKPDEGTTEILRQFRDSRLIYLSSGNWFHVIDQRNYGLQVARSEFVALMDADDYAEKDRFECQLVYLQANDKVDIVGSQITLIDVHGKMLGTSAFPEGHDAIVCALRSFNPICHPSVMLRRSRVLAVGGYQYTRYPAEDYELWSRLCKAGLRFKNIPDSLLRYRLHNGQVTDRVREVMRGVVDVKRSYWVDEMRIFEKCRFHIERALLLLPASLVRNVSPTRRLVGR